MFVWTLSEGDVDWRAVGTEQAVNHFKCAAALTTKAGLYSTMAQLHWWTKADARAFFPRCYHLSDQSDRQVSNPFPLLNLLFCLLFYCPPPHPLDLRAFSYSCCSLAPCRAFGFPHAL